MANEIQQLRFQKQNLQGHNSERLLKRTVTTKMVEFLGNHENGYVLHQYKGYRYYKENPSLAVWEAIEKMLKDCRLI